VFSIGATATLTILDTFAFHIVTPDTPICQGQHVDVVAVGDPNIGSLLTYTWSPAATVAGVNSLTPTMTPTTTTTYTLTASLPAVIGCAPESHSFTIKVFDRPILTTDSPLVKICLGTPAPLAVYAYPDTIPNQYLWTPSTYLSNDTIYNPYSNPTVPGDITYTVTVNPREVPGCISTDTIRVHIYPNSISVHPADTMVCRGAVVQAIGSGDPAFHYQWIPTAGIPISNTPSTLISPDTTALYTLTATFPGCPVMTATLFLDVQPNPVVYAGGNRFLCQYDSIHIAADVMPHWYSHYSYDWTPGTYLDDSTAATVVFTGNATTKLYVDVTTPAGCKARDSVVVTFVPGNFVASIPNKDICPHDTFTVFPTAPAGTTFQWFPSLYVSDSFGSSPLLSPVADVTYTVLAISPGGCKDTATFTVKVHEAGVIFLGDSVRLFPGDTYQFEPQTNCSSLSWFPPQGLNDPYASNPIANPEISTQYVVHGVTSWGCKASDSLSIYVDNESVIMLPNAFTPGNGPNSEFKIIKKGLATLNYFRIFNRWGNLVFETTNIDEGWNGRWKDQPQPFGVYVFEVQAVTSTGKIINKGGNITLIR
jgi:gliding motility-associated-like protein